MASTLDLHKQNLFEKTNVHICLSKQWSFLSIVYTEENASTKVLIGTSRLLIFLCDNVFSRWPNEFSDKT